MEEEKNLPLQHNNAAAYCLEIAYFCYFLLCFLYGLPTHFLGSRELTCFLNSHSPSGPGKN